MIPVFVQLLLLGLMQKKSKDGNLKRNWLTLHGKVKLELTIKLYFCMPSL